MNSRIYTTIKPATEAAPFKPLRPLDAFPELPGFPVDTLPPSLADYACEVSATVQCAVDMPAVASLAACATAVQRSALVAVGDTHREPLNLWAMIAADPSDRKSETFGKVFFPVYEEQSEIERRLAPEIEAAEQLFNLQKGRLATLEKQYFRTTGAKLDATKYEIDQARASMKEPPTTPRFTASDVTPEVMATILFQNGGRLSVIDPEGGGPIANAFGRFGDSGAKLENLLRAYRGDAMQIDRRGRHETIFAPCLTLALALQPGVLRRIGGHPEAREQGFAARFLYSIPNTKAGTRLYQNRRMSQAAASIYKNRLARLLRLPAVATVNEQPEFPELALTGGGLEVWREYHDATEKDMRDGGPLAGCRDFAGKLAGHAARLAGILAMIESGGDAIGREIPADVVRRACVMMRDYFQPHGLAAYEMMFETGDNSLTSRVVAWLNRHQADLSKNPIFSRAELYRHLCNGADVIDSDELDGPLAALVDRGYIRQVEPEGQNGPGRKASPRFEVNPIFFNQNG